MIGCERSGVGESIVLSLAKWRFVAIKAPFCRLQSGVLSLTLQRYEIGAHRSCTPHRYHTHWGDKDKKSTSTKNNLL